MEPKKSLMMKTYRIVLSSLGVIFVDAESYSETETALIFHRGGMVFAEYPRAMVRELTEVPVPPETGGAETTS